MSVLAIFTTIGTSPLPTIQVFLYSSQEITTSDNGIRHASFTLSGIRIDINVGFLSLKTQVVRIFAFFTFFANTSFKIAAQKCFWVNCFTSFISFHLSDTLEERCKECFLLSLLLGLLLCFEFFIELLRSTTLFGTTIHNLCVNTLDV